MSPLRRFRGDGAIGGCWRKAESKARYGQAAREIRLVISGGSWLVPGRAHSDHQRKQMVFPRVGDTS